jgi:hypothetical protein
MQSDRELNNPVTRLREDDAEPNDRTDRFMAGFRRFFAAAYRERSADHARK